MGCRKMEKLPEWSRWIDGGRSGSVIVAAAVELATVNARPRDAIDPRDAVDVQVDRNDER